MPTDSMDNYKYNLKHRHSLSDLPRLDLNGFLRPVSSPILAAGMAAESRLNKIRRSGRYDKKIQLLMDLDLPSQASVIPRKRAATECDLLVEEITLAKRHSRSTVCSDSTYDPLDEKSDWMCKALSFGELEDDLSF